jgi:hypothetical protein
MLDPEILPRLRDAIQARADADNELLENLRTEIQPVKTQVKRIMPRSVTSVALVASDGGNNRIHFDPFLIELVRVVDNYGYEFCLDAVSPTTDTDELSKLQFDTEGNPQTGLGELMADLGVNKLYELSPMIPDTRDISLPSGKRSWVMDYRDLCEWGVLYDRIVNTNFGTDTLFVRDGQLRSKLFARDLLIKMKNNINDAIRKQFKNYKRRLYVVGFAKHTKVLTRYQLAMHLEDIMQEPYPCYLQIPRDIEAKAYKWSEYARGSEVSGDEGEAPKFVMGTMYFVRFGSSPRDPVWSVDILDSQIDDAQAVFGFLLSDAINGFPIPFYPMCLQRAHEYAALVDFDIEILQDEIFKAIRKTLPKQREGIIDGFRLKKDVTGRRYG